MAVALSVMAILLFCLVGVLPSAGRAPGHSPEAVRSFLEERGLEKLGGKDPTNILGRATERWLLAWAACRERLLTELGEERFSQLVLGPKASGILKNLVMHLLRNINCIEIPHTNDNKT